jgi:transcriptional regulator with XRE-family HTH domain
MARVFNDCVMSPRSAVREPAPAAEALAERVSQAIAVAVQEERRRRRLSVRQLATRARVSPATVTNVEAARRASLDVHARLAVALGLSLDVSLQSGHRRRPRETTDLVHAAMGELEARLLRPRGYEVAVDHPYQHYQFAGRADLVAWTMAPATLLHIENRTRFPDLQQVAGSYNAKRQFLAATLARQVGLRRFGSETHVMVALWSAEVIHSIRLRSATFSVLCPDADDRLRAWLSGTPPPTGTSSSLVLLDPFALRHGQGIVGLERVLAGVRPRMRDYRDAAERLRAARWS